jgi:hypothetical protein
MPEQRRHDDRETMAAERTKELAVGDKEDAGVGGIHRSLPHRGEHLSAILGQWWEQCDLVAGA